ncbi:MAG: insulinase family protein [Chloroflexi bacterium]|nr:MAG: insulinase family protein [Chloroflexota bacterium]
MQNELKSEITRVTLSNGLLVLLKEIHTAPIVSQWIWYRVGARNEVPGLTGLSHWVEHMQFKGTPRYPSGVLDRAVSRVGGGWNAFTFLDWTTYYEVLPSGEAALALEIESDRMINSIFNPEEVESERTVIIAERQGNENEPMFRLSEGVQCAAFQVHPYRNEVIGEMNDLKQISREDLYRHYRTYYNPNNAVLTLAGDFETDTMLKHIRNLYEGTASSTQPTQNIPFEPTQEEERYVTTSGPGETVYMLVAYKAPTANHPDFWPFLVLDSLLSGPSNFNMFGGGISNKTSRLYQALVEKEITVGFRGGMMATIDPFLYNITATLHPDSSPERLLEALDTEIKRFQDSPPGMNELERAEKQARALFAYGSESISNQGYWLGLSEMFDTYAWFTGYLDRISQVTPEDVLRAARTYLIPSNRVTGVYEPTGETAEVEILPGMEEGE